MMRVDSETETPNEFPQRLRVRAHQFRADVTADSGGVDSAPGPHDYFDAALIACKTLTATWYAKKNGFPLERVEAHVERDATGEVAGRYLLRVTVAFHGPLNDLQRKRLHAAVDHCPIHTLMTSSEVVIETTVLEAVS